jgi:hypothetical protein
MRILRKKKGMQILLVFLLIAAMCTPFASFGDDAYDEIPGDGVSDIVGEIAGEDISENADEGAGDIAEEDASEIADESVGDLTGKSIEEIIAATLDADVGEGTAASAGIGLFAGSTTEISGTTTIEAGGQYQLGSTLANADITIATSDPVTLIGNGIGDGSAEGANTGMSIIGNENGIDLTLSNAKIFGSVGSKNVFNFIGGENTLTITGTNLIEGQGNGGSQKATVRVASDAALSVEGSGTLYFYKQGQGAGFGSDAGAKNGDLTFSDLTLFAKATQPGPAIGSGSGYDGIPSNITIDSGEYTLIANAMGACIGGGMGGGGGGGGTIPGQGGNVYINGGTITINVDYAGAAIGGGGYRGGNIAEGGALIIAGGSLRTVCDENALSQWGSYGITEYGVTDKVITATKMSADGEPVYPLVFDTSLVAASDSFDVEADGEAIYTGGNHLYKFINEEYNRDTGSPLPITTTQSNWVPLDEPNLYFFLTGEAHELIVNGETFNVLWDEESGTLGVESDEPAVPVTITGTTTIDAGGQYQLDAALANADITIATSDPVTLIGNGIGDGGAAGAHTGMSIIGNATGTDLTLLNVKMFGSVGSKNVINFTGGENTLTIAGINLLEGQGNGGSSKAMVRVAPDASLSVEGSGTLYFYKQGQGAGFGSDNGAKNGDMTFRDLTMFGKGTQPGPNIGSGANYSGAPGNITFNSGEYTLINNARGACIGGGSGGGGGTPANPGGNVYINGGTFNINVDYSGAAIGGGGYQSGNDAAGGNLIISGGSLRTFIDYNAVDPNGDGIGAGLNGDSLWPVDNYGVNDAVITASKLNGDGTEPVYLFAFDTKLAQGAEAPYTVDVDGETIYTGGKHGYKFVNEDLWKNEQIAISNTLSNWTSLTTEDNLYFYLTGTDHELIVNEDETLNHLEPHENQLKKFGVILRLEIGLSPEKKQIK